MISLGNDFVELSLSKLKILSLITPTTVAHYFKTAKNVG